jgi:hypothetical protein
MAAITTHCDRYMKYVDGRSIINLTRKYLPKPDAYLRVSMSTVTQTRRYPFCIQPAVSANINMKICNITVRQLHEPEIQCRPICIKCDYITSTQPVQFSLVFYYFIATCFGHTLWPSSGFPWGDVLTQYHYIILYTTIYHNYILSYEISYFRTSCDNKMWVMPSNTTKYDVIYLFDYNCFGVYMAIFRSKYK